MEGDSRIIKMPDLDYKPDPRGLGYAFFWKMHEYKDQIAQIDALNGQRQTYADLLERSKRVAVKLRSKGITCDDIVMSCSLNTLDSCIPLLATTFLGAKVSALDPTFSLADTTHLLKQVTPKIIFAMEQSVEILEQAIQQIGESIEIVVFGNTTKNTPFTDFMQENDEVADFKPIEIDDIEKEIAFIVFSSGTSGLPKGICIHHSHFMSQCESFRRFGYDFSRYLDTTSLYWLLANVFLSISILTGSTRLVMPKFELRSFLNTIDKHKPSFIFATPVMLLDICNHGIPKGMEVDSIKEIITGGVNCLPHQVVLIRKTFPRAAFLVSYGQSEVITLSGFKAEDAKYVLNNEVVSCGKTVPGFTYKIVDVETNETLGPNQQGELRLKSQFKLSGYYKQDWSEVWDSEGWYSTGDIVYYDENHCLYVVDRIKEILKYQGWHVPPAIIENVLLQHPAVDKCTVIGIPHEVDGDHPMAIVILKSSHKNVTADEIKKFVDDRVDDTKKLRGGVKIVDNLSVQLTGKIKKRVIRNMVLNGEL